MTINKLLSFTDFFSLFLGINVGKVENSKTLQQKKHMTTEPFRFSRNFFSPYFLNLSC